MKNAPDGQTDGRTSVCSLFAAAPCHNRMCARGKSNKPSRIPDGGPVVSYAVCHSWRGVPIAVLTTVKKCWWLHLAIRRTWYVTNELISIRYCSILPHTFTVIWQEVFFSSVTKNHMLLLRVAQNKVSLYSKRRFYKHVFHMLNRSLRIKWTFFSLCDAYHL